MDKYDEAIELLLKADDFDSAVRTAWTHPGMDPSGCLFAYCTPDGDWGYMGTTYGCLTQVHSKLEKAATKELTEEIRQDNRIPDTEYTITPESLPVFAEWQRKMDKLWDRK